MTITIDAPLIEQNYSQNEIKLKFLEFLKKDIKSDSVNLFQISINELSEENKEILKNIDTLNFVNY